MGKHSNIIVLLLIMLNSLYSGEIPVAYEFTFKESIDDINHVKMGIFKFKNNNKSAVELPGFGFLDKNGSYVDSSKIFRVRFEQFLIKNGDNWEMIPIAYCGTGAKDYKIESNTEYEFRIPLGIFKGKTGFGKVKLLTENSEFVCEPFEIDKIGFIR